MPYVWLLLFNTLGAGDKFKNLRSKKRPGPQERLNLVSGCYLTTAMGSHAWDAAKERFVTYTDRQGLYWFWLETDKIIMVVSCFDR